MKIRTVISPTERGLMIRNKTIVDILAPGVYWQLPVSGGRIAVASIEDARCGDSQILSLAKTNPELAAQHFVIADLSDNEAGVVYQDNKLVDILPPGTNAMYWRGLVDTHVELVDISLVREVNSGLARTIGRVGPLARRAAELNAVLGVDVQQKQIGFVYENGVRIAVLEPGYYLYWRFNRKLTAKVLTTRMVLTEVSGQEILTKDRVSLRLNLSAIYRIADPALAEDSLDSSDDFVYRELQLALRRAVGGQTLDQLLADKAALDAAITQDVTDRLSEVGLALLSVGVKDVILPGDMKEILNQVVAAEKSAQANNIKRREETAATRSLLNTAKLMADNPVLVRLKELEALEKVTTNVDRLTVFGGMDGVMTDLVKIAES